MNRLDVLIASLPPSYLNEPSIAPAVLKSAVEKHGFSCKTLDFSLHCLKFFFNQQYEPYLKWANTLPDHSDFSTVLNEHKILLHQATDEFIKIINDTKPQYVALSVFSLWQQRFAYFLCKKIKESNLRVKLIIGGMGCTSPPKGLFTVLSLSYFEKKNSYASFMIAKKLADFAIVNDGEIELVRVLQDPDRYQNSLYSNETVFDHDYYPNFDDYKLDDYLFTNGERKLLVQGSKGCVRQCVFCSEHSNYSKFYFKSGNQIANEIIALSQKYKIFKFQFTDSLVNGSLKEFKNFVKTLAQHNQASPDSQIRWHGNYICRAKNQMTDTDFQLMKLSGAHGLTIGAESGSNQVLAEMKKNTTAEDLLYEISKFHDHGIDCTLLFMIGFYSETWQDFLLTLEFLKKLHKYFFSGTISNIRLGYTLMFDDILDYSIEDFKYTPTQAYDWVYLKNPTLTLEERVKRRLIAQEFCDSLGIPVAYANEDLSVLDAIYSNDLFVLGGSGIGTH